MNRYAIIVGAAWLCWPSTLAAQGVSFEWTAPEGCPTEAEVRAQIEQRLGRPLQRAPSLQVVGKVSQRGSVFALSLRTKGSGQRDGFRYLEAPTCRELASAASLIAALAIDPTVDQAPAPHEPLPTPETHPVERSDEASPRRKPPPPEPSAQDASPMGEPQQEPPSDLVPTAPEQDADVEPSEPPLAAHEEGVDNDDEADIEAPASESPPTETQGEARSSPYFRLSVTGDFGSLPAASAGPRIAVGLWAGAWRVELSGLWLLPSDARVDTRPEPVGEFELISLGLGACYRAFARSVFALAPCLRPELGQLSAAGTNIRIRDRATETWALLALALEASVELTSALALEAEVGAGVPLLRTSFSITGVGVVHETDSLVGRLGVGLSLRLW